MSTEGSCLTVALPRPRFIGKEGNAREVNWRSNSAITARLWRWLSCLLHCCLSGSAETPFLSTYLLPFDLSLPVKRRRFARFYVPASLRPSVANSKARMTAVRIFSGSLLSRWGQWLMTIVAAAVWGGRAIDGGKKRNGLIGRTRFWGTLCHSLDSSGW